MRQRRRREPVRPYWESEVFLVYVAERARILRDQIVPASEINDASDAATRALVDSEAWQEFQRARSTHRQRAGLAMENLRRKAESFAHDLGVDPNDEDAFEEALAKCQAFHSTDTRSPS